MFNMKKLSEARVMHDAALLGYKPYTAGTGPSTELCNTNNEVLHRLLSVSGVESKIVPDSFRDPAEGEYTAIKVLELECVYDRWGYTTAQGEIDQVGIYAAYEFLYNMFEANKIGISMQY